MAKALPDNLRQKASAAMQCLYVGDYLFSKEEISQMCDFLGESLRECDSLWGKTISPIYDEVAFVTIVNIIKEWNSTEDSFLNFIYRKLLGYENSPKTYNYIVEVIDRLARQKRIFVLSKSKKKYYATILAHAHAPLKSSESFFELCWEIFCEDLDLSYSSDSEIYTLIAKQLSLKFSNSNDDNDFQLGSHVYSFRAGIKGLAVNNIGLIAQLIEYTIQCIDVLFNDGRIEPISYFNTILIKWWENKSEEFGKYSRRKRNTTYIINDYKNIRARYYFDSDTVYLVVPSFRLRDHYDESPILTVYLDGKEVSSYILKVRGSGLLMTSQELSLPVSLWEYDSNINICVRVTHCDETIYDSGSSLHRAFSMFNNKGKEIHSLDCQPGNYYLFIPDFNVLLQYPQEIHRRKASIYTIYAKNDDILQSHDRTVVFANEFQKRDIVFSANKRNDVLLQHDGEEYSVIDGEVSIVVDKSINIADYGISYEGVSFHLTDFSITFDENNNTLCIPVTELLKVGEPQKITVFRFSNGLAVTSINVVKFNHIQVSFDHVVYYDQQNRGIVHFLTEKYDESSRFSIKDACLIPMEYGELYFSPPILKWRIDDKKWCTKENKKGMWFHDITNSSVMQIGIPLLMHADIIMFLNGGVTIKTLSMEQNTCKLGQEVYSLLGAAADAQIAVSMNNAIYPVVKIYLEEQFLYKPYFDYGYHGICWMPQGCYIGNPTSTFLLSLKRGNNTVYSHNLSLKKEIVQWNNVENGEYELYIDFVKPGFVKRYKSLWNQSICVGNKKEWEYAGCHLCVHSILPVNQTEIESIQPFYIDNLHYIDERDGNDFFSGDIYIVTRDGRKVYLNIMRDNQGMNECINPIRIEMRNKHSGWIVYGMHNNDIDDFAAEFTLNEKRQISVDPNGKAIEYYIFDIRRNDDV